MTLPRGGRIMNGWLWTFIYAACTKRLMLFFEGVAALVLKMNHDMLHFIERAHCSSIRPW